MIGTGTLINTAAILAGGTAGVLLKNALPQRVQTTVIRAVGVCVLFIGISGALEKMLVVADGAVSTQGSLMLILSMALGSILGAIVDIDRGFVRLGEWLKKKTGSEGDTRFLDAFLTASLTVCIGAMAIVGSIQDGMLGDWSLLATKSLLDFVSVMIMASSLGKGCIFSALPVLVLQGSVTLLSRFIEPLMTAAALSNLSLVGSVLIFCVGVNLVWDSGLKVANMLPSILFAVLFAFLL